MAPVKDGFAFITNDIGGSLSAKTKSWSAGVTAALVALSSAFVAVPAASAAEQTLPVSTTMASHPVNSKPCADVETVFARGSGQNHSEVTKEAAAFAQEMDLQVRRPTVSVNNFELGSYLMDADDSDGDAGSKIAYPAQSINDDRGIWTSILAKAFSGGRGTAYGDSVDEGVAELTKYLEIRAAKCKDSAFVLGGYSQGAQVIGETYVEKLSPELRGRVVFNSLFGDPKTYLPEGRVKADLIGGTAESPAMCRGLEVSPYRFNVPNCWVDEGSLNGRTPYLPTDWTHKTGLWCNNNDFVCGSANLGDTAGHDRYIGAGKDGVGEQINEHRGPIAEAVREIKKRLIAYLPPSKSEPLKVDMRASKLGANGLDMVFLIDSTGSMGSTLEQAKAFVATMADRVKAVNGRVALVEYRDAGFDPVAVVRSPLQEDTADLQAKLGAITAGGGGDWEEGVLHGLMTAFNQLDWKNGAAKAAVVLTDAPFHDPDLTDGTTLAQVVKRSLEIDPVNVYPVVPGGVADYYTELATATTGKVIENTGDAAVALEKALTSLESRPYAALALPDYYAAVGSPIRFDASGSYPLGDASIATYEWDVNADGIYEAKTTAPEFSHAYPTAFDGMMQVRVTDSNGEVSSMSAKVHVGGPPAKVTTAPADGLKASVLSTANGMSTVELSWESSDPRVNVWGVSYDGVVLGRTEGTTRSVTISDVRRSADAELGVVGATAIGELGARASVIVPALSVEKPPVVPVPPTAPPVTPPVQSTPVTPTTPAAPVGTGAPTAAVTPASGTAPVLPRTATDIVPVALGEQVPASAVAQTAKDTPAAVASAPADAPAAQSTEPTAPAETKPSQAPPAAVGPSTPAADLGPWPWLLGAIVILGVAAVSLVYRRRNSA